MGMGMEVKVEAGMGDLGVSGVAGGEGRSEVEGVLEVFGVMGLGDPG